MKQVIDTIFDGPGVNTSWLSVCVRIFEKFVWKTFNMKIHLQRHNVVQHKIRRHVATNVKDFLNVNNKILILLLYYFWAMNIFLREMTLTMYIMILCNWWLNDNLNYCIGRGGSVNWTARSSDHWNFMWGHKKRIIKLIIVLYCRINVYDIKRESPKTYPYRKSNVIISSLEVQCSCLSVK